MKTNELKIKYKIYELSELSDKDRELIEQSILACNKSYSPYSNFKVGCAIRLDNNNIIIGSNQENIAYPSGLCAERIALFNAGMQNSNVVAIAISSIDENNNTATAYPCGACRQVIYEFQNKRSKNLIKVLILQKNNTVLVIDDSNDLLPFSFEF